jgi:7-cyano-7-deazaguanine reductase
VKEGQKAIQEACLEKWDNPYPERNYTIDITFPEFSCLCPKTGYPDYSVIKIHYIPDASIVELKSLKLYLNQYRDRYISHEAAANEIYSHLFELLSPRFLEVIGDFHPRGNVKTLITVKSSD